MMKEFASVPTNFKHCLYIYNPYLKSFLVHLRGLAGSNYEEMHQIGAAHITEHLLLKTTNNNNLKDILQNGGKILGVTSRDDVLFFFRILEPDISTVLETVSHFFEKVHLNKEDLVINKKMITQEILRVKNLPEKFIIRAAHQALYGQTRLGKLNTGEVTDINKLTKKKIWEFQKETYNPSNFVLVIQGNYTPEKMKGILQKSLIRLPKGKKTTRKSVNIQYQEQEVIRTHEFSNSQLHYYKISYYGENYNSKEKISSLILANFLDVYLTEQIKEKKALTYQMNCNSYSSLNYGIFSFYFSTLETNVLEVKSEIGEIINNIRNVFKGETLNFIKKRVLSDLIFNADKPSGKSDYYSEMLLWATTPKYLDDIIKEIENTSVEQIHRIANKIFSQKPKTVIIKPNISKMMTS